jgi:hypothetical protein
MIFANGEKEDFTKEDIAYALANYEQHAGDIDLLDVLINGTAGYINLGYSELEHLVWNKLTNHNWSLNTKYFQKDLSLVEDSKLISIDLLEN